MWVYGGMFTCMCSRGCSGNASEDVYGPICISPVRSSCHWERAIPTRTILVSTDSLVPEATSFLSRSQISTHFGLPGPPLAYLLAAIWDLRPFLQDSTVSSSLGTLHIFAPILCCRQKTLFVPPCYSFDYNAALQGEARKNFASQFSYFSSHGIF